MTDPQLFCPVCQGQNTRIVQKLEPLRVRSSDVTFLDQHSVCDDCGEEFYTYEQSMASSRARTEAVRKAAGLVSPDDIRRARMQLNLSQAQFEKALGIGPKTVVRWERGTVPPSGAANAAVWFALNYPTQFMDYARERIDVPSDNVIAIAGEIIPGPKGSAMKLSRKGRGRVIALQGRTTAKGAAQMAVEGGQVS